MNFIPVEGITITWCRLADMARIVWDDVTLDELIDSEGDEQKLAMLVQQRYGTTHDEARRQVKSFFRTAQHYLA